MNWLCRLLFSLFNKKQNQKAFELFLAQVTQFIETKVDSEESVLLLLIKREDKTFWYSSTSAHTDW